MVNMVIRCWVDVSGSGLPQAEDITADQGLFSDRSEATILFVVIVPSGGLAVFF